MNELWKLLFAALAALFSAVLFGYLIAQSPALLPIVAASLILVIFLTFHKPFYGLLVLIFTMLLSPELAIGRAGARAITIRLDDLMIIGVFVAWLAHQALIKEKKTFARTPLDMPILMYTLVILVATALGVLNGYVHLSRGSFYVLKYLEYFIIFFLVSNILDNPRQVRVALWCGIITAIIVTVNAYAQIAQGVERTFAPFDVPHGSAGFGEPATLGGYYLVVIAVMMGLFTFSSSPNMRVFLIACLLFMLPAFGRTLSRASYFAMLPLYGIIVVFSRAARIWWILLAGIAVIVLPYALPELRTAMERRVVQTFTGAYTQGEVNVGGKTVRMDLSAMARVWAWKYILNEQLPKHFLFGRGVTGTHFVDAQIPLILGETGVLGLSAFLWIIAIIVGKCFSLMRNARLALHRGLALGLLATTAALLTQSITTNTFIIVRIMEPFWFLTAIVLRIPAVEKGIEEAPSHAAA